MGHLQLPDEKHIYEMESNKLEREFFERMKAGATLEELKPILLKLKQVKLHLSSLNTERQHYGNRNDSRF